MSPQIKWTVISMGLQRLPPIKREARGAPNLRAVVGIGTQSLPLRSEEGRRPKKLADFRYGAYVSNLRSEGRGVRNSMASY